MNIEIYFRTVMISEYFMSCFEVEPLHSLKINTFLIAILRYKLRLLSTSHQISDLHWIHNSLFYHIHSYPEIYWWITDNTSKAIGSAHSTLNNVTDIAKRMLNVQVHLVCSLIQQKPFPWLPGRFCTHWQGLSPPHTRGPIQSCRSYHSCRMSPRYRSCWVTTSYHIGPCRTRRTGRRTSRHPSYDSLRNPGPHHQSNLQHTVTHKRQTYLTE